MKIYQDKKYKGARIIIKESSSDKGYQFKTMVNNISLGCLPTEAKATISAINFIDKVRS